MSTVHLLTGESMPKPDPETHLLTAELDRQGIGHRVLPWTDPEVGAGADLVVVRTPWDYIHRCGEFLDVCRGVAAPVLNQPEVLAWNSHKGYLVELAAAGVPVVPTRLVRAGGEAALADGEHEAALVVKPAVSSGSRGAGRFEAGDPGAAAHLAELVAGGDALVQPYVASVAERGERSLIFFGGRFSHAVDKVPAAGDYRVQEMYGGTYREHDPTAAETAAAQSALAAAPAHDLLYARVDMVEAADGPQVMELELIEPELFLGFHANAAERLARAIRGSLIRASSRACGSSSRSSWSCRWWPWPSCRGRWWPRPRRGRPTRASRPGCAWPPRSTATRAGGRAASSPASPPTPSWWPRCGPGTETRRPPGCGGSRPHGRSSCR